MAKPPLTAQHEGYVFYDGAGDIYRPLRRLQQRYMYSGQPESARRVGLLIPSAYEELIASIA